MFKKILLICIVLASSSSVHAEQSLETWQQLMNSAESALSTEDFGYAFYKLRKAWLSVPQKELSAEPYKKLQRTFEAAFALRDKKAGRSTKKEPGSISELDRVIRQREFNCSGDQYSVEMRADRSLAFNMTCLDGNLSEGVCNRIRMSDAERKIWNEQTKASFDQLKNQMPVVFPPGSPKYDELLSLCQPIKPGMKKEHTGFDVSPFIPTTLPRTPDI